MTTRSDLPFNIDLLFLTEKQMTTMRPVTVLDSFVGATKNFNPSGLYSNEIFGIPGTDARFNRFSYIDIKISIIHPVTYKAITKLKSFYKDIMSSKEYAIYDPVTKDFVKSNMVDGRTGYEFFCEYLPKLEFVTNNAVGRQQTITLFDKYRDQHLIDKILVLPAGFRDMEVDENGRYTADDINGLYYRLLSIANTINPSTIKASIASYNAQRVSLQNTMNEIYDYLSLIVEGKKNLMMGKWASRRVFNTTRNVITSMNVTIKHLDNKDNVNVNSTLVGLHQTARGILPKTLFELKNGFLDTCFSSPGAPVLVTDIKTLESKRVMLKTETYNQWISSEGLEKTLSHFKEDNTKKAPIIIEGNYLGLCYRGPDDTFALINGIEQLPEGREAKDCTPITMAELLYTAIYRVMKDIAVLVTRYPILGIGSIYASNVYLKTTINSKKRIELDPYTWEPKYPDVTALEFPELNSVFFNSLSPHSSKLKRLGADFDGDTMSANFVYSDEAVTEIKNLFNSKRAYVNSDGQFLNDTNTDTISYVLRNFTGRKKYTQQAN